MNIGWRAAALILLIAIGVIAALKVNPGKTIKYGIWVVVGTLALDLCADSIKDISSIISAPIMSIFDSTWLLDAKIGDVIDFGEYEGETITWEIVDEKKGNYMLVSRYVIEAKPYNETFESVTWEECSLRKWLNTEFYKIAFTEEERQYILLTKLENEGNEEFGTNGGETTEDYVYLLSLDDLENYYKADDMLGEGYSELIIQPTEYAEKTVDIAEGYTGAWWWLRNPGNYQDRAAGVRSSGMINNIGREVNQESNGVRPAVWVSSEKVT